MLAIFRPVAAQPTVLRLGLEQVPLTADPHMRYAIANMTLSAHVFEPLVRRGPDLGLMPALATGWEMQADGGWRFMLRPDALFHQGGLLKPVDVVYSLCRAFALPDAVRPPGLLGIVKAVTGPGMVVLYPAMRDPDLPARLVDLWILQAPAGWAGHFQGGDCGAQTYPQPADFDRLVASNGTGPYRLERFVPAEQVLLRRFEDYWGGPPPWDMVQMRQIPDPVARNRALVTGGIDVAAAVPPDSLDYFGERDITLVQGAPSRTFVLMLNQRPTLPGSAAEGRSNPLADVRVRRAVLLAIDREVLARRGLLPRSLPAGQLIPPDRPGHQGDIADNPFDLAEARRLMAAVGRAAGFDITLGVNATAQKPAEFLVRALARINIRVRVRVLDPGSVGLRKQGDFGMLLFVGNMISTDYRSLALAMFGCPGGVPPSGELNFGAYCSEKMEALLRRARGLAGDDPMLPGLLRDIALLAGEEAALVPVAHIGRVWALRRGLSYRARLDGWTLATDVVPDPRP